VFCRLCDYTGILDIADPDASGLPEFEAWVAAHVCFPDARTAADDELDPWIVDLGRAHAAPE
jgi:hypothetical protein